ncbi:ras association domain-containing protein 3 isoform X1 [Dermochelys coriacea]|uniref:ras association domain-containing protein 3 isoform X1 n=1 Tax=Dermochelys coriacea TaxID=27794 RepID=UPI0018E832C8|nr:ras association domain-containing protein 3 isoform X1 [Dermochelys coriacea]
MAAAAPQPGGLPRAKRRRLPRVPVVRAPRAARPSALPALELFVPLGEQQPPPPQPGAGRTAAPGPLCGRRRPGPQRPRHVRTIFEPEPEGQRHRFRLQEAMRTWCDLCCHFIFSRSLRCADCRYTCHSHCRDLVHLDCQQNGKLMECVSIYDELDQTNNGQDVQKERETHTYLSKEEVKEMIQNYNSSVTDKLKMTLNSNGTYTGFIKVQMELCRPITVQTAVNPGEHAHNNNETSFYLPPGYVNKLHISSINTVREVIEALLKKFLVFDNPAKFALYKRCHKEDQVYTCKLSDREHPLYMRLVAGPSTETLSFVLREHETGEVMWEAFSLPELQNFLRILDKEEDEQLQILKRRYAAYKDKLEEALGGVWKPG